VASARLRKNNAVVSIVDRAEKKSAAAKRVMIADDHQILRDGLRALIDKHPNFECVAEAGDGAQAIKTANELHPDIVIMDIMLPNINGIEATRQIKAPQPEIEIVALSMHATRAYVLQVLQAGASAYLLKDSAFEELITALVTVGKGGMYLSPSITNAAALGEGSGRLAPKGLTHAERLTRRELQVLQLIADGKSTKEIAASLNVSVKTVETHRKQIMDKLGIRTTAGLTKYCIREGLSLL